MRKSKYDWVLIQKDYDAGLSQRALRDKYGIHFKSITLAIARGDLNPRSLMSAMQLKRKQGWKPAPMGPEARSALSERQSLNNSGGRCKWFWVGDQHVQGTWERDAGIKLTELGVEWRKCAGKADIITYVLDGKTRRYTPDFYLPAFNLYLEFKGYWWGNDRAKMDAVLEQHPEKNIAIIEEQNYRVLLNVEEFSHYVEESLQIR
jgi:hypothetical protein